VAFGYPHADILASSGNFTQGNVTALAGMGDDSRYLQISTPVQAGNSGGPLLDQSDNLVGIVTSNLNALKMAQANGDLPQNVNFV
jgi:serine protease Do